MAADPKQFESRLALGLLLAQKGPTFDQAARDALKHFEDKELVALAEQAHPQVPDVNLNTTEGYRRWCQLQPNIMEAELKLLAISREIEDAFPHLKMRA